MSELSLYGHEDALKKATEMTDAELSMHISELNTVNREATIARIGRQAEVASRLLAHFKFEHAQRLGVSAQDYAESLADSDVSESRVLVSSTAR